MCNPPNPSQPTHAILSVFPPVAVVRCRSVAENFHQARRHQQLLSNVETLCPVFERGTLVRPPLLVSKGEVAEDVLGGLGLARACLAGYHHALRPSGGDGVLVRRRRHRKDVGLNLRGKGAGQVEEQRPP